MFLKADEMNESPLCAVSSEFAEDWRLDGNGSQMSHICRKLNWCVLYVTCFLEIYITEMMLLLLQLFSTHKSWIMMSYTVKLKKNEEAVVKSVAYLK